MIIDLFLDFGNPTMKSIETTIFTTGRMGNVCSFFYFSLSVFLLSLENIILYHKDVDVLHGFLEK
jgi:hypothetical protein